MTSADHAVHVVAATVGYLALALLWCGVLAGILTRVGWAVTWARHETLLGLHRTVSATGLTLAAVHGCAQLAVPDGPVGPLAVVLPFATAGDRFGIACGTAALDLSFAVAASVLLRRRLGPRRWRHLHQVAYAAYGLAGLHILVSGADGGGLARTVVVMSALLVAVARVATTPGVDTAVRRWWNRPAPAAVVEVNPGLCARFGFCVHEAPDVFRLRGDGVLTYSAGVGPDAVEGAERAAVACPARAIRVRPASVVVPRASWAE